MTRLKILLSLILMIGLSHAASAQDVAERSGTVHLTNWPQAFIGTQVLPAAAADTLLKSEVLPFIDTLVVNYSYRVEDGAPSVFVSMAWAADEFGVLDGNQIRFQDFPGETRLMSVELLADVVVGRNAVAQMVIGADDMELAPSVQAYEFEAQELAWDRVFVNTPAHEARQIFDDGFSLRNLRILSISFASFEEAAEEEVDRPRHRRIIEIHRRPPPNRRTIIIPQIHIDLGWWIGPRSYLPPRHSPSAPANREPRGGTVTRGERGDLADGRTASRTGRGERSGGAEQGRGEAREDNSVRGRIDSILRGENSDGKKKDDDDEDSWLDQGAVVALVAVGAVAVLGGTVGYYGNTAHAPLGVSAGHISDRGGLLLQLGVNEALIGSGTATEPPRAMLKATGFYNFFNAPLMPAFGAGVLATEVGSEVDMQPAISFGGLLNLNTFAIYGGYDVVNNGIELGLSVNIRQIMRNARSRDR